MIARVACRASCLLLFITLGSFCHAQLKADFNSITNSGCSPLLVQFNDLSTGGATEWEWDLGNGTTSFLQNPSVTYFDPGTYSVKLIVKKNGATDTITKLKYVAVYGNPAVDFTSSATTGCYPLTVKFTDKSSPVSGSIVKWEWDFGDGNNSSEQNPVHVYTSSGNYNVSLRVTTSNGCTTTLSKINFLKISSGVLANFTNNSPGLCTVPVSFNFQNLSSGTGTLNYSWNFGDGSVSTDKNPTHIYNTPGIYNVSLKVGSSTGCNDFIIKDSLVKIGNIKASFTTGSSTCSGSNILLTNTSTPLPVSVKWDFGDGTGSAEMNPSKLYSSAGTYNIKLVSNFGNCKDSVTHTVVVLPKPITAFVPDQTSSCKIPLTVNFTNQSVNGDTYKWYFGDGDSSSSMNPSHIYNAEGNYEVTLITGNVNGCSDTLKYTSLIKILQPSIQLLNIPDSGCAPFTKQIAYISNVPLTNLTWDLGDGTISSDASPSHTYVNPGRYTVSLTAVSLDGCSTSATMHDAVIASTRPQSLFSVTPRETCAENQVSFTDESTGGATKWLWDFGDGTSTDQNPQHQYTDTGYFNIRLIVWNSGCPDTLLIEKYVHISGPIARFIDSLDCNDQFKKMFTDKSIAADSWSWDFGDGASSAEQNPTHIYNAQGTYLVSQTVYSSVTGCKYVYKQDVPVVSSNPAFNASDTMICKNNKVIFTVPDSNKTNLTNYDWDPGDGITRTSNGGAFTYTYTKAGVYDVKLIVTNILGCTDTLIKPTYIHVFGPSANFVTAVKGTCLNASVNIIDKSLTDGFHSITKLIWDYGDGKTDTIGVSGNNILAGPQDTAKHQYDVAGIYTIALQAVDSMGCSDSYTIPQPIIIAQPQSDFMSPDTLSCPNKPIVFTNLSSGSVLSYKWDFGDKLVSAGKNPTHYYTAEGIYSVKLVVKDMYGCMDSVTKPHYIRIVNSKADFAMSDSVSTCPPLIVNFTDLSVNAVSKNWDFGDKNYSTLDNPSHFYTKPGTYIVKQTITGPGGCTIDKVKIIVIRGPLGSFNYTPILGCTPVKVDFKAITQDKLSFIWDFSDGSTLSTSDSLPSHTYSFFGAYVPKMIMVDTSGCNIAITGKDTINVYGADAKFKLDKTTFCDSAIVNFNDSSDSYDQITSYTWDFGDGTISQSQNAVHAYNQTGTFYPKLVVKTLNGCSDSSTVSVPIRIAFSPQIGVSKIFNGCVPLNSTLKGLLLVPDTSVLQWKWIFGNGNISVLQNPESQLYDKAGLYSIDLTVTNSSGCTSTIHRSIEAYPIPDVSAGVDTLVCKGKDVQLKATGALDYVWKNSTALSCLNCSNPVASPVAETRFFVTGQSVNGCVDTASVLVRVRNPFKIQVGPGDTLCVGGAAKISASGANSYIWWPSAGLDNSISDSPVASPDTTTIYRVIGTDERNCFTDTGYVTVKVYPIPVVDAGKDQTVSVGQTATIVPAISNDVTMATWSPVTDIVSQSASHSIVVKPKENMVYTIDVKNEGGCTAEDKVSVFVICDGTNIFMPNTFSPNNDGVNDVYYPRGTGIFNVKTFRIFNRWGEVVFEKNNFNANDKKAGWDGKYKDKKLNPDVYVYTLEVVCENNIPLSFKGNVTLIR